MPDSLILLPKIHIVINVSLQTKLRYWFILW